MARILCIEDEVELREDIVEELTDAGYLVDCADNGHAALALFDTNPADLVITDLLMREMDGIELIRALRQRRPNLPIVAISAGMSAARGSALPLLGAASALGASATLSKPFDMDHLLRTVGRLLSAAQPTRPS